LLTASFSPIVEARESGGRFTESTTIAPRASSSEWRGVEIKGVSG
jgi:hypothetical protein